MKFILQKPQVAVKALIKQRIARDEMELFKANLIVLLNQINVIDNRPQDETEEHLKNNIRDFLRDTYYKGRNEINTKGRNDLVIHLGADTNSAVGVIIEAKRPKNASEMSTSTHPNRKALQELVWYFLNERAHNNEMKRLVITNIVEWYIIDVNDFDKHIYNNARIRKLHENAVKENKSSSWFYDELAQLISGLEAELPCVYFNFRDYEKELRNEEKEDDVRLLALYKLLSPHYLLKEPVANDSNSMDKGFYNELLHIIGLKEIKDGGRSLIGRLPKGQRNAGTFIESAIAEIDSLDKLSRLQKPSQYGASTEERLYTVAMELTITWVNRILFLKLLEGQLVKYHKGNASFAFLNSERIKSYDDLNTLFFKVLARRYDDRLAEVKEAYTHVPYLNSSLFEPTDLEHNTLFVSNLRDDQLIPVYEKTILTEQHGVKRLDAREKLSTLDYLFRFLDAYDFGAEDLGGIRQEKKTIINASVLGLIFEKINGYKDGSFYTPGFITMYMCRETIRKTVVQKFNETHGWNCQTFGDLKEDVNDYIKQSSQGRNAARKTLNETFNQIRICDPAVGSGHFLVSALNEMLAVKSEISILTDTQHEPLIDYELSVVNDELLVTNEKTGELFEYQLSDRKSQRVQETLFHEKQTIIENCLFGVDINPNSVKICRLRLWIELLKNAYYKGPDYKELETLPNIDINIKCGNSLVSRFGLDAGLKDALKKSKWNMDSYRIAVQTYRNAKSKEEKKEMERLMADIKSDFRSEISLNDPKLKKLRKLSGELFQMTNQGQLFERSKKEQAEWNKKLQRLSEETQKLEAEIESIKANKIFENAFEWRFEFPEVLNNDGDFVGFDVIIGNPPYIRQEEFSELKPYLLSAFPQTGMGTADLFVYFVELSIRLLRPEGDFAFIIPNKWMRAGYGRNLRQFIATQKIHFLIDFGDLPVFEEATTYPNIILLKKAAPAETFPACNVNTLDFEHDLADFIRHNKIHVALAELSPEGWSLADSKIQALLTKIKSKGVPLSHYVNGKIFRGVLTGLNEAFVIDKATRDRLIAEDPNSAKVIKPFLAGRDIKRYQTPVAEKYLILFPKGFTIKRNLPEDDINYVSEPPPRYGDMPYDDAWNWIRRNYPAIAAHLWPYKAKAEKRCDKGDYWWELRACDYYGEFEKPKVMLPDISLRCEALLDEDSNFYSVNTAYIIPGLSKSDLGILNSKLILFFYSNLTQTIRGGYFRFIRQYLEQIPIVKTDAIEDLVTEVIDLKKQNSTADTNHLESKIDQIVYELYGLTEEEIAIVEGL